MPRLITGLTIVSFLALSGGGMGPTGCSFVAQRVVVLRWGSSCRGHGALSTTWRGSRLFRDEVFRARSSSVRTLLLRRAAVCVRIDSTFFASIAIRVDSVGNASFGPRG